MTKSTEKTQDSKKKVNNVLDVKCPKCGTKITELASWVESYYDPKFNCRKCGNKGTISIHR
jgi:ribosomal protein S27E